MVNFSSLYLGDSCELFHEDILRLTLEFDLMCTTTSLHVAVHRMTVKIIIMLQTKAACSVL